MLKNEALKKIIGDDIKENYVIRPETRVGTGGVSEFYYEANTLEELISAVSAAMSVEEEYMVLGSGSNVLFSDYGYKGLVIKNKSSNIAFLDSQIIVDSGVSLKKIVLDSCSRELTGLEPFICVPGTIGAAVLNNISAFGVDLSKFIKSATFLFPKNDDEHKILKKNREWFEFEKGTTKPRKIVPKPVLLSIKLQLARSKREEILRKVSYYQKLSERSFSPDKNSLMIFNTRSTSGKKPEDLIREVDGYKIRKNFIALEKNNYNFIKNLKKAKSEDIRNTIEEIKARVREKSGLMLEENIEYFGNWSNMDLNIEYEKE